MIVRDIDLNFDKNILTGDVSVLTDSAAVKQSLKTLMLLGLYEKPFINDLGPNITGFMFENYLIGSDAKLKTKIKNVITKYEKRVKIKNLNVVVNESSNSIDIQLEYYFSGNLTDFFEIRLERTK